MKTKKYPALKLSCLSIAPLCALLLAGCQSGQEKTTSSTSAPATANAPATSSMSASGMNMSSMPANNQTLPTIRIKAAATEKLTDNAGHVWLPDQGFADGDTDERPELTITNAADQRIYQSERYSMSKFTQALPNGKYSVKLHFCETFDGITGPGQRVFSFNVNGKEFKDFDVWVKAGGPQRAYVESVPVDITNGKLEITFTPNVENPEINGIEIIPAT